MTEKDMAISTIRDMIYLIDRLRRALEAIADEVSKDAPDLGLISDLADDALSPFSPREAP